MKKILLYAFLVLFVQFPLASDSPKCPINLFVVGTGAVGGELLRQIYQNTDLISDESGIDLRVIAIANSRKIYCDLEGIDLRSWRFNLEESDTPMTLDSYLDLMFNANLPNMVFVDCTSSQEIANAYKTILDAAIWVVTPNKKANSGPSEMYDILQEYKDGFAYDANVGAGLPILSTIQSLREAGDDIVSMEAVLSGSLSYIFNTFKPESGTTFADVVRDAQAKGYTEPDPRDDLSGMDVARKLVICCREAGFDVNIEDIEIPSILPVECVKAGTVADFYEALTKHDGAFQKMLSDANAEEKRLRFIASFKDDKATIALCAVGKDHPFYNLSGSDNIIAITTQYYKPSPLVIKGPGAGVEVTASKVLQGIVRLSKRNAELPSSNELVLQVESSDAT